MILALRKFFLHVGLPKTGTTTLQVSRFPEYKQLRYLGKFARNMTVLGNSFHPDPLSDFYSHCLHGLKDEAEVFEKFAESLRQTEVDLYGELRLDLPILISEECFVSSFFNPVFRNQRYGHCRPEFDPWFERLTRFFSNFDFDLEVVVVIRQPRDMLVSMFMEYRWDDPQRINDFFDSLIRSKELQNAYSIEMLSRNFWEHKCSENGVNVSVVDFESAFNGNLLDSIFGQSVKSNSSVVLNDMKKKKLFRKRRLGEVCLRIAKLVAKSQVSLLKAVGREFTHNERRLSTENALARVKGDELLAASLISLVKECQGGQEQLKCKSQKA